MAALWTRFMQPLLLLELLILLAVANGTPVIAKKILGDRLARPLDGGTLFYDGKPVFGPAKTIRGIVTSLLVTPLAAWLMGLQWELGVVVAAAAMVGDLCSSFVKRRMALPSGSMALGLDHIPESLLPLLGSRLLLPLSLLDVLAGVAIFCVGALLLSPILYRFNLRDRPY
jgi:CDP-2,3-bis-(O-geranylgeranyl)-sn-glycerol synthase